MCLIEYKEKDYKKNRFRRMKINFEVHFETYERKGDSSEADPTTIEKFHFDVETLIIDVRDEMMWKIYRDEKEHEQYYLEIENITPKLYKDFGKLFFNSGLLPRTIDNFPLSKFVAEERTYQFLVYRVKKTEIEDYNHNVIPSYMKPKTEEELREIRYKKLREEEEKKIKVVDNTEEDKKKREEYHKRMDDMEKEMSLEEHYKIIYGQSSKNKKIVEEW